MRRPTWACAALLLLSANLCPVLAQAGPNSREAVAELVNAVSYGVPTSPAFALLPEQPSEVTHILTPADFQSNAASWLDGTKLKSGMAFDWRPLASMVGSLDEYRRSSARQVWWRTVLSAGTAPAAEKSPDVLLAVGLRLPLVDRGDLRRDPGYVARVRGVLGNLLDACPPATPIETAAEADKRCASERANADSVVRAVQDSVIRSNWNALRFDIGVAGSARAANGYLRTDSIAGDRAGFWLGLSHPLTDRLPAQVTHVFKASWARTDSATQEQARFVAGTRVRAFPFGRAARSTGVSLEGSGVWTNYGDNGKDDAWLHVAAVVEIPLPRFGGLFNNQWLAVAYGGDSGRSDGEGTALTLRYSVYSNRLLQ